MDPKPLNYKLLLLTDEESILGGKCINWSYAYKHKDRWIDADMLSYELQTYDRGMLTIVNEKKAYLIVREFTIMDEKTRLFVCKRSLATEDQVK